MEKFNENHSASSLQILLLKGVQNPLIQSSSHPVWQDLSIILLSLLYYCCCCITISICIVISAFHSLTTLYFWLAFSLLNLHIEPPLPSFQINLTIGSFLRTLFTGPKSSYITLKGSQIDERKLQVMHHQAESGAVCSPPHKRSGPACFIYLAQKSGRSPGSQEACTAA